MGQMQTQVSEQIDEGSKHEGISCDKADGIPGTESPGMAYDYFGYDKEPNSRD